MKGTVEILRLEVFAFHGVLEQERRVGNLFEVSVGLRYDFTEAAATDDVARAINYAEVVDTVKAVMDRPRNLLETVATDIRSAITDRWPAVEGGYITVAKVHPPISAALGRVQATIEW